MGRKGIGKLAPFGIARVVDVVTSAVNVAGSPPIVHWLRFRLSELLGVGEAEKRYPPEVIANGLPVDQVSMVQDTTGQVKLWRDHIMAHGCGTIVVLSDLSLARAIPEDSLLASLGERFTVAIERGVEVRVNGRLASSSNALPELDFRIPTSGVISETVGGREVKAWAGFVKSAQWPQDQAGVGVYAHGKIAQDRPFTFGVKGREIFSRYMFAVVEADWLDEQSEDLISTDRTTVNWDSPATADLFRWGGEKVKEWIASFEKWRSDMDLQQNKDLVQTALRSGRASHVTSVEEDEIARLISQITPSFGKDEEAKSRMVTAVADAWVQKPMRRLIRDLWDSVGKSSDVPPERFTTMVERLSSYAVPESLNLAVVFAQRAFALTRLHDYVHHGTETNLQNLIERFPWIVEPDLAVLTANQQLRTAISKAESLGQIPTGRRATVGGVPDNNKPDFVFLSSPNDQCIVVVELKNPQVDLTIDNRSQLVDYLNYFEAHYSATQISGYLIGRRPDSLQAQDKRVEIIGWSDILNRSRSRNLELLAAMILATGGSNSHDARLADAIQLGGPEATQMLEKLATEHEEIRKLMEDFKPVT